MTGAVFLFLRFVIDVYDSIHTSISLCSGFDEYLSNCTALIFSGPENHDEPLDTTAWRKEHSRRLSPDRQERPSPWPKHVDGPPSGFGGMRGASSTREGAPSLRGRPERYSRDLR